ncbi:histidine kinase [Dokdonella sp.]|uniref:sensor histidine kinase n=1 Tax=Dokdonella sp. TaxID=2291710 RepID=UPI0026205A69|nr:histidine kinase [Dokdonella sp.]
MGPGTSKQRDARPAQTASNWLPQFCSAPTLFAVMIVAELVALVVVLVPEAEMRPLLPRLGVVSLYVQWLALLNVVVLCSLRQPLARFDARAAYLFAGSAGVAVTALASAVVCRMDQALGLGLSVPAGETWRFVLANAGICALIAAALLRYLFVLEQWRERVQAASRAQVDALQARIRPHFLFNSMNTIASLVRTRPAEAERTVEDLADLFRAALGADTAMATLGEELELADHYLRIEQLRLGARLQVERDFVDLPLHLPLPRLLLQPLVENAVYHGVQPRADGGTVVLRARSLGDGVEIAIENPLPQQPAPSGRNGVALANVRARIEYHFGARGGLQVEAGAQVFRVTLRLPGRPDR